MDTTKRQAKALLTIKRDVDLARLLGTTKQAVSRWQEDEALPDARQWQLRAMRPDLFPAPAPKGEAADAA